LFAPSLRYDQTDQQIRPGEAKSSEEHMPSTSRQTFEKTLLAVGPENAQTLERKANIAASLAGSYPEYRDVLRALETKALDQVFRILTGMANSHGLSRNTRKGSDREPAGVGLLAD
jgi:hypothetical protein